ncbi:MAG: tRNA uridine-5-carboxymethylaminomethyl(34) synthesis enzyme MnmG [Planctomycetes bacterium TMED75]|nr:tRNA uridine-5-carboxymethylaminomethyl(34) synthesis enzyme MnmG [Planctomycetaceae bacterium]OUU95603.1 MAG: tRNA uridine-5-carboxymethylaminomethyl(34) synthesis enzyme MnmG [Planctomycetes bacterium TMED75]
MNMRFDVIVVGAGHAGTEAAWAAAGALGPDGRVAMITMDPSTIGTMSCNPAIGGLGKGQIVREIDALGGLMGLAADASGILFKVLNASRGAAVRGPRCQNDKYAYRAHVQHLLSQRAGITVISGRVDRLEHDSGARITGVLVPSGGGPVRADNAALEVNRQMNALAVPLYAAHPLEEDRFSEPTVLHAPAVVLTTGTFMRALMHTGDQRVEGGRAGEGVAVGISDMLRELGFELGRLKTGTPPRLLRSSLDWDGLDPQYGDESPVPFSDLTSADQFPVMPQIDCRITRTDVRTHELIRSNLHRAPMYSGQIDAESGPRYCPSIEDKVVRFEDRDSHHVFLEPESLFTEEVYCNGISTSLPADVQEHLVHSMPGCEHAEILRWGYAVEYDMVRPHQLDSTGMTRLVDGLFLAGQINGTSGYEEAGGQGLIAGMNAARLARGLPLSTLGRDQAYIGVMMDDLVTRTPREPYRMFTSRAEHRLLLRADNTDQRLTGWGREHGLVDDARWLAWTKRSDELDQLRALCTVRVSGEPTLEEVLKRQDAAWDEVVALAHQRGSTQLDESLLKRVATEHQYEGYIRRQAAEVKRQQRSESVRIPSGLDPHSISGLRNEARDALARYQPTTLGQASRVEGITPADLTLISLAIRRLA